MSAWSGGCLPGPGGVCLVWGASAWSGVGLWSQGGLPGPGGGVCLVQGGVSAWSGGVGLPGPRGAGLWSRGGLPGPVGGGLASQHALRQTPAPCGQNHRRL